MPARSLRSGIRVLALALGFAATAQAQPATLTLACKGTVITDDTGMGTGAEPKAHQVSMGIIVNFTTQTVQGFGWPGRMDYPVTITGVNDTTVAFSGQQKALGFALASTTGTLDRVTGDLGARIDLFDEARTKMISQTTYALQCRPTERMF
jgi:hypothetical protein